jgi:hypothetical protein
VACLVAVLATGCTDDASSTPTPDRTEAGGPELVPPAPLKGTIAEGDSTVVRGDIYSYLSVPVCLTEPGTVRVTGVEFDPEATGVQLLDTRARAGRSGGFGSGHGTLDDLGFKADPGNRVTTTCDSLDDNVGEPAQIGLTVRRTGREPGQVTMVRVHYLLDGEEKQTDWLYNRWTFGADAELPTS